MPYGAPVGEVVGAVGKAMAEDADGAVRQLHAGDSIYQGDVLVTGAKASLEVRFLDDAVLSQGAGSRLTCDAYVFDPANQSGSGYVLKMAEGGFRMLTGKIAEVNPDGVKIESPLATIGIRGTTTVHQILPNGVEKHGAEDLTGGRSLLLTDQFGNTAVITFAMGAIDFAPGQPMGQVRIFSPQEILDFKQMAPLTSLGEPAPAAPEDQPADGGEGEGGEGEGEAAIDGEGDGEGEAAADGEGDGEGEAAADGEGDGEGEAAADGDAGPDGADAATDEGVDGTQDATQDAGPDDGAPAQEADAPESAGLGAVLSGGMGEAVLGGFSDLFAEDGLFADLTFASGDDVLAGGDMLGDDPLGDILAEAIYQQDAVYAAQGEEDDDDDPVSSTSSTGVGVYVALTSGMSPYYGTDYADTIIGTSGTDEIYGGAGDDSLIGNGGSEDTIHPGLGDDDVYGEIGYDTDVHYTDAPGAVYINMNYGYDLGLVTGASGTDTLHSVEIVTGSNYDDTFVGGDYAGYFRPGEGNDHVEGHTSLYATVDYGNVTSGGVVADLRSGAVGDGVVTGASFTDTLHMVRNLYGSNDDDSLFGDDGNNRLRGRQGDDTLDGGGSGDIDVADYKFGVIGAVTVDLSSGQATGGGGTDTLINMEGVRGSSYGDSIVGSSGDNWLEGYKGDDTINSGAGGSSSGDTIIGGEGHDRLVATGAQPDHYFYEEAGAQHFDSILGAQGSGSGNDYLHLKSSVFQGLLTSASHLKSSQFHVSVKPQTVVSNVGNGIYYGTGVTSKGIVYYDADGGTGVNLVTLCKFYNSVGTVAAMPSSFGADDILLY